MTRIVARLAGGRVYYGWVAVAVTFLMLLMAASIRSSPGVLIVPLEDEFGWSRASISLPIGIGLLLYGLIGPFSAAFIDRFGIRAVMLAAVAMMLAGFGLTPFIDASWQLLPLWGIAVGTGTGLTAMIMAAVVANRWFVERRGLVMGLLTGSTGAGQLLFLPVFANMVVHYGWRAAILAACGLVLLAVPLILMLMRDHPADVGLEPYGQPAGQVVERPQSGSNPFAATFEALGRAVAARDFWLLSLSFFICGASTLGLIGTHFIAACLDHGIPEATAATLLAGMGACNFLGTTGSGWLTDRFDSRHLLFLYYGLRGLSLLLLPYSFDLSFWGLSLFGLFYGLDWVATVPPTVRLLANPFGPREAGMMFGWVSVVHQIGSAFAAYGGGLLRTYSGDYLSAFVIAGGLCFVAAILVLGVGRPSRDSDRRRPVLARAGA